jgi:hypothetical protein
MKWGQYYDLTSQRERLFFEVIEFIVSGEIRVAETGVFGFYFDKVFAKGGGLGGDPGWGIKHIVEDDGPGVFLLESDPVYSSSETCEAIFGVDEVFEGFTSQLTAYLECYPESDDVVTVELARLPAYREELCRN